MQKQPKGRDGQSGQAAVESAIILPMMIFLVLGVIQMGMLQQARLMTEYAAFNAVRSGIVYNGDPCMMRKAAVVSLLPTMRRTDTPGQLVTTWGLATLLVEGTAALGSALEIIGLGDPGVTVIDVQVLNPSDDDQTYFREGKELDFDIIGGVPGGPDFATDPEMRRANVLTVRVTYLYPMRIPFANWTIFYSWLAQRAGTFATGGFFGPGLDMLGSKNIVQDHAVGTLVTGNLAVGMGGDLTGLDDEVLASTALLYILWSFGRTTGTYLFPLHATHSMRMQSNFFAGSLDPAGSCIF